ncbi:MAG TPA: hypothetical protein VJ867_12350 [Gemmatimonadaceae bacterium]|nr:hypothetical protein [Gemmatimonadaceae bacterium]
MTLALVALLPAPAYSLPPQGEAPLRLDRGRFVFLFYPRDRQLATSLASSAVATDTFPGLPRPQQRVIVAIAPDKATFRQWAGGAPEWGSAIAFPESRRIVLQGSRAGSDAGDPIAVLRHEVAHLALHEYLGDLPPRWFDEGYASYAAREWGREEVLMTNVALAIRGMPTLEELDQSFNGGANAAQSAYALAYRAVAELAQTDRARGLTLFFRYWRESGTFDRAVRLAYGETAATFEERWRSRTRRQYGVLALVSNVTIAGMLLLFILTPLYVARRRRDRHRLQLMKEADAAAERAAQTAAIDELLRDSRPGETS